MTEFEPQEPDFDALAESWLAGDRRTEELSSERREQLKRRLAEALAARRRHNLEQEKGDLVVSIDRSRLGKDSPIDHEAIIELARFVEEVAEEDPKDV